MTLFVVVVLSSVGIVAFFTENYYLAMSAMLIVAGLHFA